MGADPTEKTSPGPLEADTANERSGDGSSRDASSHQSGSDERLPPIAHRVLLDAKWSGSPEHRSMIVRHTWIGAISTALLVFVVVGLLLVDARNLMPFELLFIAGLLGYIGWLYVVWDRARLRRMYRVKQALGIADELQARERNLAESGEPLSLAELWSVTQDRIEYYHQIVTTQAEVSFRNGAITSYLGLGLILALAVIASLNVGNLATSITIGALGAVGAALSGYLGATFIKLQAEASAQLREFFSQPVEFSRLLGAERLIDSLPAEDRAGSVQLVIRAMMRDSGQEPPNPKR